MTARKRLLSVISAVVLTAVAISVFVNVLPASAEEIHLENPDLTPYSIDSDLETSAGVSHYVPDTQLEQNGSTYTLRSNSHAVWGANDDCSFAYRTFNVSDSDTDTLTMETTVESMNPSSGELIHAASMGIMFRSGLGNDMSEIFLHCRPEGIVVVYRSVGGKDTNVRYSSIPPVYPVNLRMTKTGKTVVCEFKTADMTGYKTFTPKNFTFTAPGPLYAGLCGHSNNRQQYNVGVFKNLKFDGVGTYDPNSASSGGSSSGSSDTPVLEPVDDDPVITDSNVLMYETFSDADLTDGKMAKGDYVWQDSAIKEFNISEEKFKVENKNRYLYRSDITNGALYVGSQKWTDYKATVDISFTEDCDLNTENSNNRFLLYARNFKNDYYGYTDYAAVCQNVLNDKKETVQQIALYKRTNYRDDLGIQVEAVTVDNFYGDNLWHKLSISVLDNKIKVYWDGECLIDFVDDGTVVTQDTTGGFINVTCNEGGVGISSIGTFVKIDNLLVEKIDDPIGGDFDNYIGGMWDEPIPQYILDSIEKGIQYKLGGEQ